MKKFIDKKLAAVKDGMNNNKGFSLVELIIVVAIMAVLMGVLAPQYLRFVESSRVQSDMSTANEILKVTRIGIAAMTSTPTGATVTWDVADGTLTTDNADLKVEVDATLGTLNGAASAQLTDGANVVFTVEMDGNSVPYVFVNREDVAEALSIPTA